ncbi:MAG: hypothetical protein AAF865_17615 [Pseudomonadota bacterium]
MGDIVLTPTSATLIFVLAVFAGYRYRKAWKAEGPRWELWLWGIAAACCLAIVSFVPMATG